MKKLFILFTPLLMIYSCNKEINIRPEKKEGVLKENSQLQKSDKSSEETFKSYMITLIEKGEFLQFIGFQGNDDKLAALAPYFIKSAQKTEYNIIKTEENGDNSIITVFIKSPDLKYYNNLFPKRKKDDNYDEYINNKIRFFEKILDEKDLKFQEKTISVHMVYENGKWIIHNQNNEFIDIINHEIF